MPKNEDWKVEEPKVEEPTTKAEEPTVEEPTTKVEEPTVEENDFTELDNLIEEISKKSMPVTEPTNFPNSDDEDDDQVITNEDLEELDQSFAELENQVSTMETEMQETKSQLKEIETLKDNYENALQKLWEHPVLWKLNEQLLKGEEVNIPEFLNKSVEEELDSLPNLDWAESTWVEEKWELSLQEKLELWSKQLY